VIPARLPQLRTLVGRQRRIVAQPEVDAGGAPLDLEVRGRLTDAIVEELALLVQDATVVPLRVERVEACEQRGW